MFVQGISIQLILLYIYYYRSEAERNTYSLERNIAFLMWHDDDGDDMKLKELYCWGIPGEESVIW